MAFARVPAPSQAPASRRKAPAKPASATSHLEGWTTPTSAVPLEWEKSSEQAFDPVEVRDRLGPGRGLSPGLRAKMERAYDTSFDHVRVHDDPTAHAIASRLDARAFTVGRSIGFAADERRLDTPAGEQLLAHELAHTLQQRGVDERPAGAGDEHAVESDADHASRAALLRLHDPAVSIPRVSPVGLRLSARKRGDAGYRVMTPARKRRLAKQQGKHIDKSIQFDEELRARKTRLDEYDNARAEAAAKGEDLEEIEPPPSVESTKEEPTEAQRTEAVVGEEPDRGPTDEWTAMPPHAQQNYLDHAEEVIGKVVEYAKANDLGPIVEWLEKHPPQITEDSILIGLENDWFAWNSGGTVHVSKGWIDAADADWKNGHPANVLPNVAHEAGGHTDYGREIAYAVLKVYIRSLPGLRKELRSGGKEASDKRKAIFDRYGYAETEIISELYERRYWDAEGLPAGDKPNGTRDSEKDVLRKVSQLFERLDPQLRNTIIDKMLRKARKAVKQDKLRAEDLQFLEDTIRVAGDMWAAYRAASGMERPEQSEVEQERHIVAIESKAKMILTMYIENGYLALMRKGVEKLEQHVADGGFEETWTPFIEKLQIFIDFYETATKR